MSFDDRSTALIELLEELNESDLEYVLVGGYAVSAFNTQFSTDLDIVVLPEEKDAFVEFLETRDSRRLTATRRSGCTIRRWSNTRSDSPRSNRSALISS